MSVMFDWFQGRRVFVTGHTGFKGAWLSLWLQKLGAEVTGFALPALDQSLFRVSDVGAGMESILGDVRDRAALEAALRKARPEVVIHMAAQALVRRSYADPVESFATNVMGTVNLLDIARDLPTLRAVVNVTSDKCYENDGSGRAFQESDPMGGHDPYSASKGAAEVAAAGMVRSFFSGSTAVASVRAANVIGGGDWATDRIVPDLMRAAAAGTTAEIRRPGAVRPWQHVLEPLRGYLMLAHELAEKGQAFAGGWNFGPAAADAVTVREIADGVARRWAAVRPDYPAAETGPHEAPVLQLDCTKAARDLGWRPVMGLSDTLDLTVAWYRGAHEDAGTATRLARDQIDIYEAWLMAAASE
jgi:CDP-glucose 4,6-dehydratase